MEKDIQESEEKYRLISEHASDLVSVLDVRGTILYASPSHVPVLGIDLEQYVGSLVHPYIHPNDLDRGISIFREMVKTGAERTFEYRLKHVEGHYLHFEMNAKPVKEDHGDIQRIVFISRNITKRKKAEQKLRESEERFRLIAEHASDMITIHDWNGKYTYVSPACLRLLGFKENELLGYHSYNFIHPDDLSFIQANHSKLLQTGYVTSCYRIRKRGGEYIWFESNIRVFNDSEGVRKIIAISRDITERKQLEQQLRDAQELWQELSTMDGLTGIANRRFFDERLKKEWIRSLQNSTPLSLILMDIDYFKAYNDTYGHQGGDDCLKQVAKTIKETVQRSTDVVCRYGGEEFAVILPETNQEGARKVAEKIRMAIENVGIPHIGSSISDNVTISIGCATKIPTSLSRIQDMILEADRALYLAKNEGGNQVKAYV